MTASITLYSSFRNYLGDGTLDMNTNTFKVSLHSASYTPAITHTIFSQATNELSTANGYTAGGATLVSVTWTQTTVTVTWDAADVVWTASGGSIAANYAVIYASGTLNSIVNPLIAYIILDTAAGSTTVTTTTGNTLTLVFNSSGIIVLS